MLMVAILVPVGLGAAAAGAEDAALGAAGKAAAELLLWARAETGTASATAVRIRTNLLVMGLLELLSDVAEMFSIDSQVLRRALRLNLAFAGELNNLLQKTPKWKAQEITPTQHHLRVSMLPIIETGDDSVKP